MKAKRKRRPIIAVTGPDKLFRIAWWATWLSLRIVGMRACYITAKKPNPPEPVQGVIIGGGDDIHPEHYGAIGDAGALYDAARDQFEIQVAEQTIAAQVPILGICRGAQLINVVLGGSLHTDIRAMRKLTPNKNSLFLIKHININDKSKLYSALQLNSLRVNQLHNQAVKNIAEGLQVSSRDDDEFIQSIESTGKGFIVGVQWHPEYLFLCRYQRKLFTMLKDAALREPKKISFKF